MSDLSESSLGPEDSTSQRDNKETSNIEGWWTRETAMPPSRGDCSGPSRRSPAPKQPRGPRRLEARRLPNRPPVNLSQAREASFRLVGIPEHAEATHVIECFKQYGRLVSVDLDQPAPKGQERGNRSARVRYSPVPDDLTFWRCPRLIVDGRTFHVSLIWDHPTLDRAIMTPLGKPCKSVTMVQLQSLTFAVPTGDKEAMSKTTVTESCINIDYKLETVEVCFSLGGIYQDFRFCIPFRLLARAKLYRCDMKHERFRLIIALTHPPRVWRQKTIEEKRMDAEEKAKKAAKYGKFFNFRGGSWNRKDDYKRVSRTGGPFSPTLSKALSLAETRDPIDAGRWLLYSIEISGAENCREWLDAEAALGDWNILVKTGTSWTIKKREPLLLWRYINQPFDLAMEEPEVVLLGPDVEQDPSAKMDNFPDLVSAPMVDGIIELPFPVRYQLEVCISHDVFNEHSIARPFLEKLVELSNPARLDHERGRLVLEWAADQGKPIYNPMSLFENPAAMTYYSLKTRVPDHCALIRKAVVTPTRLYFETPSIETTNRVVRHFADSQDCFLRVQFRDELWMGKIEGSEDSRYDDVYKNIVAVLRWGIRMGPHCFKYLAAGNSQMREGGIFAFSDYNAKTSREQIWKWLGNFDHIRVIPKVGARMGQCFSTTRLLKGVAQPVVVRIPDVERNGYCFSDGVGKISSSLAKMIAEEWDISETPSAFQFRMGGKKGLLVVWPDIPENEVHVRPSQEKFTAPFNGLEIVRCSRFASTTLNRQTISILRNMMLPSQDVFVQMVEDQMRDLDLAMLSPADALRLLRRQVDENQSTLEMALMVYRGFLEAKEPFMMMLLRLWKTWSLKAIKEKAHVVVGQSAFVLGCVDETGTLRGHSKQYEDQESTRTDCLPQIFLQIPDDEADKDEWGEICGDCRTYKVVKGLCMVGRNPSLHPGDIRVVEAVDVVGLHHLKNVVVFPMNGERDIPSMCSGGDLDGDDYFVIWDPALIPKKYCDPPMEFLTTDGHKENEPVNMSQVSRSIVDFMKHNTLPLIAHAHLGQADLLPDSVRDIKCVALAYLHSQAVDFPKSGVAPGPSRHLYPKSWPHWMEKKGRKSYQSFTVLGQIYERVCRSLGPHPVLGLFYESPYTFDSRILKKYVLTDEALVAARQLKSQYDAEMRRMMAQLSIASEFEAWTGFVLSKSQIGTDYKVRENVWREARALKARFMDQVREEAEKVIGPLDTRDTRLRFVAAMYQVTNEEFQILLKEFGEPDLQRRHDENDGDEKESPAKRRAAWLPMISFPWLFHLDLCEIAAQPLQSQDEETAPTDNDLPKLPEYGWTSDGRYVVHRGEVLNLFPHDEGDILPPNDSDEDDALGRATLEPVAAFKMNENDASLPVDTGEGDASGETNLRAVAASWGNEDPCLGERVSTAELLGRSTSEGFESSSSPGVPLQTCLLGQVPNLLAKEGHMVLDTPDVDKGNRPAVQVGPTSRGLISVGPRLDVSLFGDNHTGSVDVEALHAASPSDDSGGGDLLKVDGGHDGKTELIATSGANTPATSFTTANEKISSNKVLTLSDTYGACLLQRLRKTPTDQR